ncbi:MAG: sulfide/dihydroorotate dehydrogenase-like FAD/NAD-binding protein [Acetobacteraceae bacterium]|nr:sulfide/dihydroorotate dehydrogenase-like FAD/NAD-binding protein [Acetobacteraceae bacterium]
MYKILSKRMLTPVTKLFEVEAPLVAQKAQPGQFVIVRIRPEGERIPLTVADFSPERGAVTIIVQEVGKTTQMMGRLKEGDCILDFLGPLGRPAEIRGSGSVVCVGGGFGVAPIFPIARALYRRGVSVTSIIGARTRELVILEEEVKAVSHRLFVTTDDGSYARRGLVTDVLQELIEAKDPIDEVIAIGPMVMMRAVAETTRPYGIKTFVSMDPIMVDGTGMCGACRVEVGGKTRFACVDGPIFDAHQVDFALAQKRGKMYAAEQQRAMAEPGPCGGAGGSPCH